MRHLPHRAHAPGHRRPCRRHRRGIRKQDILDALTEKAVEAYRAALWPALTGPGTGGERLEQALRALCHSAEDNLELLVALRSQTDAIFHEPDAGEAMTRSVFTEPLERLLRDGIADGSLRKVDPVETATVLFNLVGWTYVHLRTGHRWMPEHARERTVEIALHGVREASCESDTTSRRRSSTRAR